MFERLLQRVFKHPENPPTAVIRDEAERPHPSEEVVSELKHLMVVETVVDQTGKSAGKFIRLHQGSKQTHTQHADTVLLEALGRILNKLDYPRQRVILVELGPACLNHPLIDTLAGRKAVLLLTPGELPTDAPWRIQQLRQAGLRLVLSHPGEWSEIIHQLADGYAFSFEGRSPVEAAELAQTIRQTRPKAALIVVDIAWREEYSWCRHIGCHYSAGKLFRMQGWTDGPLDPGFIRVLDSLNKIRQEADPLEIARTIKSDPLLTFRLLAQANAAAQGLQRKVESVEQAVVVVGRSKLYRWLVLLLYATNKASEDGSVMQEMAQVRAELMVRLGERYLPGEAEGLYLTGLFSLLDSLMQRPLSRVLSEIEVSPQVEEALLTHTGPYAPFLALAEAAEQGEIPSRDLLAACGITPSDFNHCLLDTLIFTEKAEEQTA